MSRKTSNKLLDNEATLTASSLLPRFDFPLISLYGYAEVASLNAAKFNVSKRFTLNLRQIPSNSDFLTFNFIFLIP